MSSPKETKHRTYGGEGLPLPAVAARRTPLDDPTRESGDVTAVEAGIEAGRSTRVSFEYGSAEVRFHPGGIVRLVLSRNERAEPAPSYAVPGEPEVLAASCEEGEDWVSLRSFDLEVRIHRTGGEIEVLRDPGEVRFATAGGAFRFNRRVCGLRGPLAAGDRIYGLGEKTGFLDKRGRVYEMWNTDEPLHAPLQDPLYASVPFFIRADSHGAVGVFLDEPARSWFDMGKADPGGFGLCAESETLDLYILVADEVQAVTRRYAALTGRIELPPVWALGFHQSRYSYVPDARVLEVAGRMRERQIPCDAVYLDIDYMDGYRVFTWDPMRFPDPGRVAEQLHRLGMKLVTIVDPGVKLDPRYHAYRSGLEGGHFCRRATGELYEGAVWAGRSTFPDFTRRATRRWWAELHEALLERGVDGIWNDMNEPADFTGEFYHRPDFTPPAEVTVEPDAAAGPQSLERYHNVYGHCMCEATAEAFEHYRPDARPFILTRAAYAGTQRYAAVWTGDNHSWWEHLAAMIPMVLNLGISGIPFAGADVAGFQADAGEELYARWIETAAFMPFFRAHTASDTGDHEPWSFTAEVEQIARYYIELRYSLLPYLYAAFAEAARHGTPVVRPLFFENPSDPRLWNLNDEFLLGPDLLVAPILSSGARARSVYLPEGEWYDIWSEEVIVGPTDAIARAPLDTIPLYVRAQTVLPTTSPRQNAEETLGGAPCLHVYPGSGQAAFRKPEAHSPEDPSLRADSGKGRSSQADSGKRASEPEPQPSSGSAGGANGSGAASGVRAACRLYHDDGTTRAYRRGEQTVREVQLYVEPEAVYCRVVDLRTGYGDAPGQYAVVVHAEEHGADTVVIPAAAEEAEWVRIGRARGTRRST
ncbi:MAG: TIM-barrel domain-containing protein [Spirochaetaceae bacterium]